MKSLAITVGVLALLSVPLAAHSTTWYVIQDGSGDAITIQAGIDLAAAGDIVLIAAGTYIEAGNKELDFGGKNIVLRSEEGPEVTIIDCQDSGRGIYFHSGETGAAKVEGFTITNGLATRGGGIYCSSFSWPTLTGCIFFGNSATYYGGGMYCDITSCPMLNNCTFSQNSAQSGGGICCYRGGALLTNCTFSGNSTTYGDGGGMYCYDSDAVKLTNCTFTQNSAQQGGGLLSSHSMPVLLDCNFSGNSATYSGGGVHSEHDSWPAFAGCTFAQNSADGFGGGLSCWSDDYGQIGGCTFAQNSAERGGAIFFDDSTSPHLWRTIIAFGTRGAAMQCWGLSDPTVGCCDVYGNAGGDWVDCIADQYRVNGNISEDPLFCDSENGDFTIADISPCAPQNSGCWLIGALPVGCWLLPAISGTKFYDLNGDGVRGAGEAGLQGWMITLNGGELATLTDDNGEYSFAGLSPGTYTVGEVLKAHWTQTAPPSGEHIVVYNEGSPLTDVDFGNKAVEAVTDLSVSLAGGIARRGFQKYYAIRYENKGTFPKSATVLLRLPPEVTYLDCSPGGVYIAGPPPRVRWSLGTLPVGYVGWLWAKVEVPVTVLLGTELSSTAEITPTDDYPDDNTSPETQVVVGSYDPNDKLVAPEGWIAGTDTLRYQINFQNVGTDTAFTVVIKDILDTNLDITTLQTGASLHPYTFQITGRELAWTFSGIDLPDSNVNEPESHGFVTFKVRPMPELPAGTEIENRAAVYFDFNPPVITNTVINTIIEALPATVDVDPNTLNLKSEGNYATTYIELPEGYDPWDIDVSTVLFNGALPAVAAPTAVADYDSDGVADRMVKFNRSGVIGLLSGSEGSRWWLEERGGDTAPLRHGEEFEVTVSGELTDGTPFLGTDVIRVINPGSGSDGSVALEIYPSPVDEMAMISFELPVKGPVKLCIYDAAGRLVRRLLEGQRAAGRHEITWDRRTDAGRQVSAGVYFVRLQRRSGAVVQKVLVVR